MSKWVRPRTFDRLELDEEVKLLPGQKRQDEDDDKLHYEDEEGYNKEYMSEYEHV